MDKRLIQGTKTFFGQEYDKLKVSSDRSYF